MPSDESVESRVAVLENRMTATELRIVEVMAKLDIALVDMADERASQSRREGILETYKTLVPMLTAIIGVLGGTLTTLVVAHII